VLCLLISLSISGSVAIDARPAGSNKHPLQVRKSATKCDSFLSVLHRINCRALCKKKSNIGGLGCDNENPRFSFDENATGSHQSTTAD
jgi:hypothetical protein